MRFLKHIAKNSSGSSMSRFSLFVYLLIFSVIRTSVSESNCDYQCQTTAVIEVLRRAQPGQVLVSKEWFNSMESRQTTNNPPSDISSEAPCLVYELSRIKYPSIITQNATRTVLIYKYSSPDFAHVHQTTYLDSASSLNNFASWKLLYLTFRTGTTGYPSWSMKESMWNTLMQKDLFIFTFNQPQLSQFSVASQEILHYKRVIWIGCTFQHLPSYLETRINSGSDYPNILQKIRLPCLYSSQAGHKLLGNVANCNKNTMHIDQFIQLLPGGTHAAEVTCNSTNSDHSDISSLTRRKADPLSKKGFLYSSLVFIAKKIPESATNVWGPFTVASWIGILAAYTVTAIVFGVIKIVTMNNLDNSWYDCSVNQLLSFMNDDKVHHPKEVSTISSNAVGIAVGVDENENFKEECKIKRLHPPQDNCVRRISVRSLTVGEDETGPELSSDSNNIVLRETHHHRQRGKMSKAILYGTIRVVSFILLAMYEGKLYNTITFPKSKLMASFDDLISNEKYFIKVSNEAAKHDNITEKIGNHLASESALITGGYNRTTGKVVESVNILDCVNWVESGSDPNHACVGYEFELRNLHKAQKSDKILVKSKQRLLRLGSAGAKFGRRRGFTLFPGGFQISKWILESGILQLWSIVENAFMESLINPNWSDPFKVFTIRDYLGLFVVYSLLLILASIMFMLEHSVSLIKRCIRDRQVIRTWREVNRRCRLRIKYISSYKRLCQSKCLQGSFKVFGKWRSGSKYFRHLSSIYRTKV